MFLIMIKKGLRVPGHPSIPDPTRGDVFPGPYSSLESAKKAVDRVDGGEDWYEIFELVPVNRSREAG